MFIHHKTYQNSINDVYSCVHIHHYAWHICHIKFCTKYYAWHNLNTFYMTFICMTSCVQYFCKYFMYDTCKTRLKCHCKGNQIKLTLCCLSCSCVWGRWSWLSCDDNYKWFAQTTTCFQLCLDQLCCNHKTQQFNMLCACGYMFLQQQVRLNKLTIK